MVKLLRAVARHAADFLWPPLCLSCREPVAEPGSLCAACWREATFLSPPFCRCCGFPFPFDAGEALCAACLARRPLFAAARAVMRYDDVARRLVAALKYADRQEGRAAFARWLQRAGADIVADADIILPVPLHRRKLFHRRFNQSAMLAQELARLAGRPFLADGLTRTRHTQAQAGLARSARLENVRNAFAVTPRWRERIRGAHVLLVDDVLTTGATAQACTRALLAAGAAEVFLLVLARVVEGQRL